MHGKTDETGASMRKEAKTSKNDNNYRINAMNISSKSTENNIGRQQKTNTNNTCDNQQKEEEEVHCTTLICDLHKEDKQTKAPIMEGFIQDIPCIILIDSGSQVSCISSDLYTNIKATNINVLSLPVGSVTIIGATGSKSKTVREQVYLFLQLSTVRYNVSFLVVILGTDWLNRVGAKINFAEMSCSLVTIIFHLLTQYIKK